MSLRPDANPVQLFQHAASLHSAGKVGEAIVLYRRLERLLPGVSQLWHFHGLATLQTGDARKADRQIRRALILAPGDANCLNRFACIHLAVGDPDRAAGHLRQAIAIDPEHAEAHFNLAEAERARGNREAALAHFQRATEMRPSEASWQLSKATILTDLGRADEARPLLDTLACAGLRSPEFFFQMGRSLFETHHASRAISFYRMAMACTPGAAEAYNNVQLVLRSVERHRESVASAKRARALRPGDPVLEYNLADALFAAGDLRGGYDRYAWRHAKAEVRIDRHGLPAPWDGRRAADGGALLICQEQGIGDEIRLASCVPDISRRYGGRVLLECDPRLVTLFQRSFPAVTVIGKLPRSGGAAPVADYGELVARQNITRHLMLGDMPGLVRPAIEDFPREHGFLVPDASERQVWRKRLEGAGQMPAVGLCWRSGLRRPGWRQNDLEVGQLGAFFDAFDFLPVCLQYDECEAELRTLEALTGREIFRPGAIDQKNELDRVAAMIAALDLVVSTNTSVLFIAGAVGTPAVGLHGARGWVFLGAGMNPWLASERSVVKGGDRPWNEAIAEAVPLVGEMLGGNDLKGSAVSWLRRGGTDPADLP